MEDDPIVERHPPSEFYTLVRVHDRIWNDRKFPFQVRLQACQMVWNLVIKNCTDRMSL